MTTMTASSTSAAARRAMIDSQLRTSGVNEEFALARMLAVPREDFLPEDKTPQAYTDRSIALGNDAYLGSPLFYGKLLLEADPDKSDNVLIVEGGTRYLAELLRPLVGSIDTMPAADAAAGKPPKGAAYSLVVVDGAIEQMPETIAGCVAEGGRIVSGLLLRQVTRLAAGRKVAGHLSLQPVEDIGIPVLHAFDKPKSWTF
uniref:protein-L-isoaspartate O-methyltransferase family protein n=1 Tax=uncultured Erythrobacter sp. TaxID=263913 RepID=UPI00261BCBB2|nr:protein-L-isoaspartate O-methyltransferase [uncultured Erythrobacter sp.]